MAALTASTVLRESMGSLTLNIVNFASVTTAADTWTGPSGIVAVWAVCNTDNAATSNKGVSASFSGTTITLSADVASPVTLFIASRS